jgi:hypothetical protein
MKKLIIVCAVAVCIYALLVAGAYASGGCPKYFNRMPKVVMPAEEPKAESVFTKVLCPLTGNVY